MLAQANSMQMNLNELGKQLIEAAKLGDEKRVCLLMTQGAPFSTDWLGMSPLHYSCMNGHVHTTELLCRSGVSWNGRTKTEKTPLHYAAQYGHRKIVALLIKLGADVNAIDMVQMTPVHWAVVENHFLVIKLLVENRVDINIKNKFDKTPVETAKDSCNYHIVEYLKSTSNQRSEETYEDNTDLSPTTTDPDHSALVSFAALCGSPSLTESLTWMNSETTSAGAAVLLEGASMVTLTEGGKMALQAYIYEEETSRSKDDLSLPVVNNHHDNNEKVLSVTPDNQTLSIPVSNSLSNPTIKIMNHVKLKTKENTLPVNRLKRKLSFLEPVGNCDTDTGEGSDPKELKRKLEKAQWEAAAYREKLQIKEQEVNLWKKKLEVLEQKRS